MDNYLLKQEYSEKNLSVFKTFLSLIRVRHYIKNLLIFIPLIFSINFTNTDLLLNSVWAFMSFCFAASYIYIINDLVDRDQDRLHPVKRFRPIASGNVSTLQALSTAFIMLCISLGIASNLNTPSLIIVMLYLLANVMYSLWLKNMPILDVTIIALGFILRVLVGGASISIPISKWLLLTIMTLSFYLGFAKRRNELSKTDSSKDTRKVLKEYTISFLEKAMNSMMTLSIAFYALWSIDSQVVEALNSDKLIATVPFVLIGMFKYSLIIEGDSYGDPTDVILSDRMLQLIIISYILFVLLIIYL